MVTPNQKPVFHSIPHGYTIFVEINGKWILFNPVNYRYYDPIDSVYYNPLTKKFEKPSHQRGAVLNPLVLKPTHHSETPKASLPPSKKIYRGRFWETISLFSKASLKKSATLLSFIFAGVLATISTFGTYATYRLMRQGNPVGVVLGFLTAYFTVATYKYAQIALQRLYPKPLKQAI